MSKKTLIILFILLSFFVSCGINKFLGPKIRSETGYIFNLTIKDNILSFQTKDSTFVELSYQNKNNQTDKYRGWTAGNAAIHHTYYLPVNPEHEISYEMSLSAYYKNNSSVFQDTAFVFVSTMTPQSLLKVHFLNVQQGDAMLIQSPDGKNMMVDGGYGTRRSQSWQGGGVPIALNYLINNDVSHLEYIIETHRHEDHFGGLNDIRNSHIAHDLYISPNQPQGFVVGSRLSLGNDVKFDFLNINYPPYPFPTNNINNTSIVLKATYGDAEFLFTGDIDGDIQNWLYDEGFDLSVDVLKVSHHGSSANRTSDELFLSKTLNQFTKIAILSFGLNNPYNHPRAIDRFNQFFTYSTNRTSNMPSGKNNYHDDCGHIVVYSDGKMVFVRTER